MLRARHLRLGGIAVSVAAVAAVVWWISRQEAPSLPSGGGEIAFVVGSVAVYAVATLLRGERWFWLLDGERTQTARADAYALTTVGYMGNNILPARGGDALRIILQARRSTNSSRTVIGSLIAERLLDIGFLLSLFVLLAYTLLRGIDAPDGSRLGLVAIAVTACAGITYLLIRRMRYRPAVRKALDYLAPVGAPTTKLRGAHAGWMIFLTLGIWAFEALAYLLATRSLGLDVSPIESAYLIAVASVFLLIPSGPGYAGTLDAAILFGLGAIGISGSDAVSALIVIRFVLLVPITVSGLVVLLLRYGGLRTLGLRRASPGEGSGFETSG